MLKQTIKACSIALVFLTSNCFAQKELSTTIRKAVVYQTKAKIIRQGDISINKGIQQLLIPNLPTGLDESSIQVSATGAVTILGIKRQLNYLNENNPPREIQKLKDSIELLSQKIKLINNETNALGKEESLLLKNQEIGGKEESITASQLQAIANYFGTRIKAIGRTKIDLELKKQALVKNKTRI